MLATSLIVAIALVAGVVFAVNLLPAFGPPTWAVLVALRLSLDVSAVALVLIGALSAACGRWCLGTGAYRLRRHLAPQRREAMERLGKELRARRSRAIAGLALFALSPVPSAQLFIAAGLTKVAVLPLTVAFFAGRLVSYTIYVSAAEAAHRRLGSALTETLRSPWAIAAQAAMLVVLVALIRIDWSRVLDRAAGRECRSARGA